MTRWATLLLLLAGTLAVYATPPAKVVYSPSNDVVPAYGPTYSSSDDLLKQILEEVKGLRKDVQSLKQGAGQQQDGALAVIATRCLACHQDGKAQDKGGDFVLVEKDGALAELSVAEKRRIVRLTQQGKMPPTGKIADAEVKQLTEFFEQKEKPK